MIANHPIYEVITFNFPDSTYTLTKIATVDKNSHCIISTDKVIGSAIPIYPFIIFKIISNVN